MHWLSKLFVVTAIGVLAFGGYQLGTTESSPTPQQRFERSLAQSANDSQSQNATEIEQLDRNLRRMARHTGFEAAPVDEDFTQIDLIHLDGQSTRLTEYADRWILLNFWASWCVPCREEIPSLDRLQDRFAPETLTVLPVNVMEPREDVSEFVDEQNLNLPTTRDPEGELTQSFGVEGLPVTWVIAPNGEPLMRFQGRKKWDRGTVTTLLKALIQQER